MYKVANSGNILGTWYPGLVPSAFWYNRRPFFIILTNLTNYKDSHLGNLQYHTATHIIYSTTVTYTTYNTIQYLHHYY